jgi:hypothetical protein
MCERRGLAGQRKFTAKSQKSKKGKKEKGNAKMIKLL